MIPGKPRKSPSKRSNKLKQEYVENFNDVRSSKIIKWLGRQTHLSKTLEGSSNESINPEDELFKQFKGAGYKLTI